MEVQPKVINIPSDLADACAKRAPPQVIFTLSSKYYEPVNLGMLTEKPYNGGPLIGFTPVINNNHTILNGFCCNYYGSDGRLKTEYFGLDDLVKIKHTCMSHTLATALKVADPEVGKLAHQQVEQVQEMLRNIGA